MEVKIKIGDQVKLAWHGSDDWLRVLYVWGNELTLLDYRGKPIQANRSHVKQVSSEATVGMYLVTPQYHEAEDNQFLIAGFFNGAYWRLSGVADIVTVHDFEQRYSAVDVFTVENVLACLDKMLVMLPIEGADDAPETSH